MRQQFTITLLVAIIFWAKSDDSNVKAEILRPLCPLIRCLLPNCENGYIVNQYGCTTCECNPCKFGQPLFEYPCGQGQNSCVPNGGLCKVSNSDDAYCCPNEHPGCCPPISSPRVVLCFKPNFQTDAQCEVGQKCCGPCLACVNVTIS